MFKALFGVAAGQGQRLLNEQKAIKALQVNLQTLLARLIQTEGPVGSTKPAAGELNHGCAHITVVTANGLFRQLA